MAGNKGRETDLSELELAITTIVECYNNYAGGKTSYKRKGIGKANFTKLVQTHLPHMFNSTENKEAVEQLMHRLDQNEDGVIDFKEYWDNIGAIVFPIARILQPTGKNPP